MSERILNSAVVGLGVGEQHAVTLFEHELTQLTDVVDHNPEQVSAFFDKYNLQNINVRSFDTIIRDANNDLISLASFDDDHYEQVMACLKNDKHVFVEKPLCQTKQQLNDIYQLWKTKQVALASNLLLRKAPLYLWLRERIAEGAFGEIYAVDGDYLYGRVHKITDGWRKDVNDYSVMEGGGIHMIDLMMYLTGQKPDTVSSCINKIATQNTNFKYHDFHSATFNFPSGMIGRITANFGCVHPHQHALRIFGTKGTFIHDDMGARVHWSRNPEDKPEMITLAPKPESKGVLLPDFINDIFENNIMHSVRREVDLMTVVLTADDAIHNDKPTAIEYITT